MKQLKISKGTKTKFLERSISSPKRSKSYSEG